MDKYLSDYDKNSAISGKMILGACQESCLKFHNCQRCHEVIPEVSRKIYRQVVVHLNILFKCRQIRETRRIYNSFILAHIYMKMKMKFTL